MNLSLVFYIIAIVLFVLAGVGVSIGVVNLVALGLAAFVAGHIT